MRTELLVCMNLVHFVAVTRSIGAESVSKPRRDKINPRTGVKTIKVPLRPIRINPRIWDIMPHCGWDLT